MSSIIAKNIEAKATVEMTQETKQPTRILFISDCDPKDLPIKGQIERFDNLAEYDRDLFANRDLAYFATNAINYVWINLNKEKSRDWVRDNLNDCEGWTVISTFKGSKNQKWLLQMKEYSDFISSVSDLNKIKSLSLDEFTSKVQNLLKISKPEGLIKSCLACLKKKN